MYKNMNNYSELVKNYISKKRELSALSRETEEFKELTKVINNLYCKIRQMQKAVEAITTTKGNYEV